MTWRSAALPTLLAIGAALFAGCSHRQTVPTEHQDQVLFEVLGMDCPSCEAKLTDALTTVNGVIDIETSIEQRRVQITYDSREVWPRSLEKEIAKLGHHTANLEGSPFARPQTVPVSH